MKKLLGKLIIFLQIICHSGLCWKIDKLIFASVIHQNLLDGCSHLQGGRLKNRLTIKLKHLGTNEITGPFHANNRKNVTIGHRFGWLLFEVIIKLFWGLKNETIRKKGKNLETKRIATKKQSQKTKSNKTTLLKR
jgi:hypothetical protein